jgi:hypothetical protein
VARNVMPWIFLSDLVAGVNQTNKIKRDIYLCYVAFNKGFGCEEE